MSEKKEVSCSIPMKCCGQEADFQKVFKPEYYGTAFEFRCKICGGFTASANLYAAIKAWNETVNTPVKKEGKPFCSYDNIDNRKH